MTTMYSTEHKFVPLVSSSTTFTSSFSTPKQTNYVHSRMRIFGTISAISGTSGQISANIEGYNPASGNWVVVASSSSKTTPGDYIFEMGPGIADVTGISSSSPLPLTWRVTFVVGGTNPSVTLDGVYAELYR